MAAIFVTDNDLDELTHILGDEIQARIGPGSRGKIIHDEELSRINDGITKILEDLSIEIKEA